MLSECLKLRDYLKNKINLKVINMPNINSFKYLWLKSLLKDVKYIFVLEDHMRDGFHGRFAFFLFN